MIYWVLYRKDRHDIAIRKKFDNFDKMYDFAKRMYDNNWHVDVINTYDYHVSTFKKSGLTNTFPFISEEME